MKSKSGFSFLVVILLLFCTSCSFLTTSTNKYTVAFVTNGGSKVESQVVEENGFAQKPQDPTKQGFDFVGWTTGEGLFDFENTPITKNTVLFAEWQQKEDDYDKPFMASGVFDEEDFVQADGEKLRKNFGQGDEIKIIGVNAGGYLVIEQWMSAFVNGRDHKTITEIFVDRFGKEKTLEIWANGYKYH